MAKEQGWGMGRKLLRGTWLSIKGEGRGNRISSQAWLILTGLVGFFAKTGLSQPGEA